jgi:hypothetical protein
MAISITSLTPVNPTVTAGSTVTFTCIADNGAGNSSGLFYEWQFSIDDGATYSSVGLFNNNDYIFTTSALSENQTGIYYRVIVSDLNGDEVFSNQVAGIGNRIVTITGAPRIFAIDEYDPSYTVAVGATIDLRVELALANVDITTATNYSSMVIEWEQSVDNGTNWTTVTSGTFGEFNYAIATTTQQVTTSPSAFTKASTLTLSNITFASNLYQYRAKIIYPGASNTPTYITETLILVNPTISIFRQPGIIATDTKIPVQCYKTSVANSGGPIRLSVGAFTTSGQTLIYGWEFASVDSNNIQSDWSPINDGVSEFIFRLKPGTTSNSDVLELDRAIYAEKFAFRCVINGSAGETEVTSDAHYIYMKDIEVYPISLVNTTSLEDYYDPTVVPNSERYLYTQYPIRTAEFESGIDIARNTGLNGLVTIQFQRKNPGSTVYVDIGEMSPYTPALTNYVLVPSNTPDILELSHITPPLRINLDNGAMYRVKVTATSLYTLTNGVKTLQPVYSNEVTLSVFREIFITTQPTDVTLFPTQTASFLVGAISTSSAAITYQWQDAVSLTSGWANITNGGNYSGATTTTLVVTNVNNSLTRRFFRCVVTVDGGISSTTSSNAKINIAVDSFTSIDSINDYSVNEFSSISWTINPQSLSLGTILFQWQKSTNYNTSNPAAATWNDIAGQTTNTFSISSVVEADDEGFYRCKMTSLGGVVAYTNAALLAIFPVRITITQNIPTAASIVEAAENAITFAVVASASIGPAPTYQWQIQKPGFGYVDFGSGYLNDVSTNNSYTPRAFDRILDNGSKIRCRIRATEVPGDVFSNECTITVDRRFSYFADAATKIVSDGGNFSLNLNPSFTGGSPAYQWQVSTNSGSSWTNISGETSPQLLIPGITFASNNYQYRCQVTLDQCTQFQYNRGGVTTIQPIVGGVGFTQVVALSVSNAVINPQHYSIESAKTGASIGLVICVPKPGNYVHNPAANVDDYRIWGIAKSGNIQQNLPNLDSSGAFYTANKPSWVTDSNYKSPQYLLTDDRFPGFIELRGQWLYKNEYRALYAVIGDVYGSTATQFRLPNPYGKKLMGTGNVNNNGGNVSIIPLYNPDGTLGGDKNVAGSIGGVWNYVKSAQLPPGSPGVGTDGTAGVSNAPTFKIGNYTTTGFTDCEAIADTTFSGKYTFTVGPLGSRGFNGPPTHSHVGISAGFVDGQRAKVTSCFFRGQNRIDIMVPYFYAVNPEDGTIISGPEGIPEADRGRDHSHSIAEQAVEPGDGDSNHSDGKGDTTDPAAITKTFNLESDPSGVAESMNIFLEPAPVTLSNASRFIFNSSLAFYLKNNEEMPVNSNYFRLKYMIKAY